MKLVIGLGNPGPRYIKTRHNYGFMAVDALAGRLRASDQGRRWRGVVARATYNETEFWLLKPHTYMNLSGLAVAAAVKELNCPFEDILVICDDLALDLGVVRFRARGSAGGQKGLASVIDALGTAEFARLRLGIGADSHLIPRDFVLDNFQPDELTLVNKVLNHAVEGVLTWSGQGIEQAMASFNGPVPD